MKRSLLMITVLVMLSAPAPAHAGPVFGPYCNYPWDFPFCLVWIVSDDLPLPKIKKKLNRANPYFAAVVADDSGYSKQKFKKPTWAIKDYRVK